MMSEPFIGTFQLNFGLHPIYSSSLLHANKREHDPWVNIGERVLTPACAVCMQTVHVFRIGAVICSAPVNQSENNREKSQQMS